MSTPANLFSPDPYDSCHWGNISHPLYQNCFECENNTWCDIAVCKMQQLYIKLLKEGKHQNKKLLNELPEYWKYVFAGHIKRKEFPDIPMIDMD